MQNAFPILIMAFADDLVLISESLTEIESLLKRTKTFMSRRGMKINPRKSYLMGLKEVGSKKQLCIVTEPFLRVEISIFPRWGLAATLDIWASSSASEELEKSLRSKVNATRLAWWDRLVAEALPKWRHGLAFGQISIETYQKLDRHVRRVACKILHSAVNLSKEWIHLSIRMGGLGISSVT